MSGYREIKKRIASIKNTEQITRAMQLVAASKMKKAQDMAKAARPYSLLLAEIIGSLPNNEEIFEHPFFKPREVKKRGVLVISTDKGLCGPLNSNLFRLILDMEKSTQFIAVGRKASQFLARSGRNLLAEFSLPDTFSFAHTRVIIEFLIKSYLEQKIDTLEVLFPRFLTTLAQESAHEKLLPLTCIEEELKSVRKRIGIKEEDVPKDNREILAEPNTQAILDELPHLFIKQEIHHMFLETKASEHSARMVAMKSATDNAKALVSDLKLEYNKARQSAITQEILEIAAAASASSES